MKKEWADKWVSALRSGKYEQGQGCLLDTKGKYCCLGVLTELVEPNSIVMDEEKGLLVHNKSGEWEGLPPSVMDKVGMKSVLGDIPIKIVLKLNLNQVQLANLNDNGYSFKKIANIIEDCWEEL